MLTKIILIPAITLFINSAYAQESWVKYPNNPVLKKDTVLAHLPNDIIAISDPWVIKAGSIYKMWYTCAGLNYPADTALRSRICYSESSDGITWTKYSGNPVLDVSYSGSWDSSGVETASVLIDSLAPAGQRYKMWYAGQYFNAYRYDIGYAYSADGKSWTKYPSQVLQVGSSSDWDGGFIEGPTVLKEGNIYKMWYTGYDLTNGKVNTGYATSADGIAWTKYAGNPIITIGSVGAWDSYTVQDPHVIKIGNTYHMWYGGQSQDSIYGQETGYAYSNDGINWTKSLLNPVLRKGIPGTWDANIASFPSVLFDNGILKMWYTGKDVDPPPPNSLNYYWELGYASDSTFSAGIISTNAEEKLLVYPNPASNVIFLETNGKKASEEIKIMIYDVFGREVNQSEIMDPGSTIAININDLPQGIYLFRIIIKTGQTEVKFIKQ